MYLKYVTEGVVAQITWEDSTCCIFILDMGSGVDFTVTTKRRPNETATCARTYANYHL